MAHKLSRSSAMMLRAVTEVLEQRQLLNGTLELDPNVDRSPFAPIQVQPTLTAPKMMAGPVTAPSSFSLLPDYVTPVRDQGLLGGCWSFGTYGSLESGILKSGGSALDFSEDNLVKYHGFDWGPDDGGNSYISEAYLSRGSGPVSEADEPYHDYDDRVTPAPVHPKQGWVREMTRFDTAAELKDAVMTLGALYVTMHVDNASFRASDNTYYYTGSAPIDHAVTLVGWDDAKVTAAPIPGAWLIKNSWGDAWGDNGYFWISYADTKAVKDGEWFGDMVSPNTYDNVYYHDTFGSVDAVNAAHAMNRFVPAQSEVLKSVGFFTLADGAGYTVTIYDDLVGGVASNPLATISGTQTFAGWHTVDLTSAVPLAAGNDFYVRLSLTNGGSLPQSIDRQWVGYSSASSAAPNESWYSDTGATWADLNTVYSTANFNIKAYSTIAPTPGVDLMGGGVSLANENIQGGHPVVTFTVKNMGTDAAGGSNVRFYLSDDQTIDPATDVLLTVDPADVKYQPTDTSAVRVDPIATGGQITYTVTLVGPASDPFDTDCAYFLGMVLDADNEVDETAVGAEANNSNVGIGFDQAQAEFRVTVYDENMDDDPGWILDAGWEWGQPTGGGGMELGSPDPTAGFTGTNVIGYNLDGDYSDFINQPRWARMPAFNATKLTNTQLTFYRWLGVEMPLYDHASIEVSSDNIHWTTIWANPTMIDDSTWTYQEFDISAIADGQKTVYVRWGLGSTDFSITGCGWNIDDVKVTGRGDINAPTDLALDPLVIPESAFPGVYFGTFSVTDTETDETYTYELVSGTGSEDNSHFRVYAGRIMPVDFLDFETKGTYSIRVKVTDSSGMSLEKALTITTTDANDFPSDVVLSPDVVAENLPAGTAVSTLVGSDQDAGDTLTYALVPGIGDEDNALFELAGNQLIAKQSFDYEVRKFYHIRVAVTDAAGAVSERQLTVWISNANDLPTAVSLSKNTVPENREPGVVVGALSMTDQDYNDKGAFTLVSGVGSADNASFYIDGRYLKANAKFDYEQKSTYTIRVRGTDAYGQIIERSFVINVGNTDEAPVARVDTVNVNGVGSVSVKGLANDYDPEGKSLALVSVTQGAHGSVVIQNGALVYRPAAGYTGSDSFTYVVRDAAGNTSTGQVKANVTIPTVANLTIGGTAGNDVISLAVVNGVLRAVVNGVLRQYMFAGLQSLTVQALAGHDKVTLAASVTRGASILGSAGNDSIVGGAGNDTVRGGDGADSICGVAGADVLIGDGGADVLKGGSGADQLFGGDGNDSIYGGAGNDTLRGDLGNDSLYGEDGNDVFFAIDGSLDRIDGGLGIDVAHRNGSDVLLGVETSLLS